MLQSSNHSAWTCPVVDQAPQVALESLQWQTRFITPDEAKRMLQNVRSSTRSDRRLIAAYQRDMERGLWKLNGEPIIMDGTGKLLAGRHRLHACIGANKPFPSLVIAGVPSRYFETIDTLRRRTAADVLTIRKQPFGRQLASALTLIWRYHNDDFVNEAKRPSIQELLHILDVYPQLRDVKSPAGSILLSREVASVLPHGIGIAMHFLFSRTDPEKATVFFENMIAAKESTDDDERPETPGAVLYATLESMRVGGGRRTRPTVLAFIIKAWNAHYAGKSIPFLRFVPSKERFPKILGLDEWREARTLSDGDGTPVADEVARNVSDGTVDELGVEISEITPERAVALLKNNPSNRTTAEAVVARYARDMESGNWQLNGQTIKIARNGRLLDGQHRLLACVKAGKPFPAIVVKNVDEEAFDTFDLGARRGFQLVLAERGETYAATLAAALKWVWLHERERLYVKSDQPTPSELDDVLARHPSIRESLRFPNKLRAFLPPALAVVCHYWCAQKQKEQADEFFDSLADGLRMESTDAVYVLRQKLMKERASTRIEASEVERMAWVLKAWNAVRSEKPLKSLAWRSRGPGSEPFPVVL